MTSIVIYEVDKHIQEKDIRKLNNYLNLKNKKEDICEYTTIKKEEKEISIKLLDKIVDSKIVGYFEGHGVLSGFLHSCLGDQGNFEEFEVYYLLNEIIAEEVMALSERVIKDPMNHPQFGVFGDSKEDYWEDTLDLFFKIKRNLSEDRCKYISITF